MKNKLTIPLSSIFSIIALIVYLTEGSISIGWLFLVIPSIHLAIETNNYFRSLKRIFWRLIFLIIQSFVLIVFYNRMGVNGYLSFLADFLLLYLVFQFGESLYLLLKGLFQKIIKAKNGVIGLIILLLIIIGIPLSINRHKKTDKIINIVSPEAPGLTFDCAAEISKLFDQKDQSLSKYQVKSKEINYQNQKYKTVVYKCPSEKESYQNVFVLIKEEKILFNMTSERFDDSEIRDINKDNNPELIITHWNGGNCWNCQGQLVFQITNDGVKNILPEWSNPERGEYPNVWLSDVNKDGIEDVLVTEDSWELHDGFFRSNAPRHITVLTWKDGEYQAGEEIFSKYYLNKISTRNKELDKRLKNPNIRLNDIIGLAIENFWDYQEIGMNDEAYANFILETNLNNLPKTITLTDSDKIWLEGIRNEIEKEYKDARPTIMMLY